MKYQTKRSDFSFLTLIVMALLVPILIVFCIYANPISWAANILTGMQTLDDLDGDLVEAIEDRSENVKLYNFILDSIIELAEEIATLETERSNAWNNYYEATAAASAANTEIKRILAEIAKLSPEKPECMSLWSEVNIYDNKTENNEHLWITHSYVSRNRGDYLLERPGTQASKKKCIDRATSSTH